jgi:hypothetical protein
MKELILQIFKILIGQLGGLPLPFPALRKWEPLPLFYKAADI